jgi:transposase
MSTSYRRCCGIDVHKKSVTVCVLPPQGQTEGQPLEREFRTFSRDLRSLRGWLKHCQVSEVVMESTGQYWRAVWNVLEGEVPHLVLVNPQHVKALAGRKTDRIDSRRLARYLENRDLQGSFVPARSIRELRDLTRSRVHLLQEVNRVKNRIGQQCEAGNIKVSSVTSDLFGMSGRRMLRALAEGKRDPGWMADYARGSLRGKKRQLTQALEGSFTDHQRWMLAQELGHLNSLEAQITRVQSEIERRMQPYEEQICRLTIIPGVDRITAWTLLSELGPDMSVFPDARHAASWAGLCPGNRESGGQRLSGRTRKANPYLRRCLCQAAWGVSNTKGTYLSALYRRLRAKLGHNKAIFALAHQLLLTAYCSLPQLGQRWQDVAHRNQRCGERSALPSLNSALGRTIAPAGPKMKNEGGWPFLFALKVPGYEHIFPDADRINPEYFKYLDRKIDYLNERGFVPFIEVSRRDESESCRKYYNWHESYSRYIAYVFSRYQANNTVLSLIHLDTLRSLRIVGASLGTMIRILPETARLAL